MFQKVTMYEGNITENVPYSRHIEFVNDQPLIDFPVDQGSVIIKLKNSI